jgi:Tfp pilus assembly protein PilO
MNPQVASFLVFVRRNLLGAICALLIAGLAVASWFLWDEIDTLEHAREERAKEGEDMLALLVGGSTLRQELAALREATHRIEDNLVVENDLAGNKWYFYRFEDQAKARLPQLNQLNSPTTDSSPLYRRVPYSIRVTGTFEQVAAFLLAVESGPRLASITSFSYSRRATGGDALTLDLTLELLGKK